MSGAVLALAGAGGASGGGGGALGPLNWSSLYGTATASNHPLTIAGITGSISLEATLASGTLSYTKNGTVVPYTGAFSVTAGDALGWTINNTAGGTVAGTITVFNLSDGGAEVDAFSYTVRS